MSRETQMTDDELTAFIERVVDEKLRERDRKANAATRKGLLRDLRDAHANLATKLNAAELRKLARGA
jgi:hypothetical protein